MNVSEQQTYMDIMYMFVNGMQQPGDTDQFLFEVKNDEKSMSYVYNRLVRLNTEEKWYFVVSPEDFVGMNGPVESLVGTGTPVCEDTALWNCKEAQNSAIARFFRDNMIYENRWPRENCDREEMKKMTFLVNFMS